MKLNQTLWALINPNTDEILGDGDAPCIYSVMPDYEEVSWVESFTRRPVECVRVRIVRKPSPSSANPVPG